MGGARPRGGDRPFGVYVHVPFCRHRCDYCAFATYTDRDHLRASYVDACLAELAQAADTGLLQPASSVFVGGGTPSRLAAPELGRVLAAIPTCPGAEVTVECNPEDADQGRLAAYRAAGVTRMSFGVQSTVPAVLASLGRRHGAGDAAAVATAVTAAGFATWNLDLIFGSAAETDADWARTLHDVLSLPHPPPHLSAYALTVEPGTPLAADPARHPDDDVQAARYEQADELLAAAGYRWEEVSNWALPGHRCPTTTSTGSRATTWASARSAHSHLAGERWWNVRTPERYVAALALGRSPVAGREVLTPAQREFEALALGLRTAEGVPATAVVDPGSLPELAGLAVRRDGRVVLTRRGRLLSNAVITTLAGAAEQGVAPGRGTGAGRHGARYPLRP